MKTKSTEIHIGLSDKEVRDFLSKSMSEMFDKECTNKKPENPYDGKNSLEWALRDAEGEVIRYKKVIEFLHQKIALRSLIIERGWDEHDVSDYTINDSGFRLHLSFIGTTEEYENLMVKLEEERENS
jgi:hypothetical protein